MGVYTWTPAPMTDKPTEIKLSGRIATVIHMCVPAVRDPEYPDCVQSVFTLTPAQNIHVADRLFHELSAVRVDEFKCMQEFYHYNSEWKAAYLLREAGLRGESTNWG